MFDDLKDSILNFVTSRVFVLLIVFLAFFGILLARIFYLQIIKGEEYAVDFTMQIRKEVDIPSTRGRIFDRDGEVLADNVLSYSVTIEDSDQSSSQKSKTLNSTISRVIEIVESHGDSVVSDFGILYENGEYVYSQEGTALNRFKADVYGRVSIDELTPEEYTSTAGEMMEYLCGEKRYNIPMEDYTPEE